MAARAFLLRPLRGMLEKSQMVVQELPCKKLEVNLENLSGSFEASSARASRAKGLKPGALALTARPSSPSRYLKEGAPGRAEVRSR